MDEIPHKFRRVFKQGGSVAVTLPPEAGFKIGDAAAWYAEDDRLILVKVEITKVDRERRKDALYDKIKSEGKLVKEDILLARFAIAQGVSHKIVKGYRDEMLADRMIIRRDDILQTMFE